MESSGELSVEVMQKILRDFENDSSVTVLPCLKVDELNKDVHVGSSLSRVTVQYTKGHDLSQHTLMLIVKVVPNMTSWKDTVQQSSMFPREIQMYQVILPKISTLLSQAIGDKHQELSARVYYTQKSPNYLIAIEDLTTKGFKPPERKNGLDLKQCLMVIKTLAKFHAASVMIHLEDRSLFELFDEYCFREAVAKTVFQNLIEKFGPIVCSLVESLPGFGHMWAERLRRRYQTIFEEMSDIWMRNDNTFNVLNHGDFGFHNLMFRHSDTGEVEAIVMVDFQCCSYNSPALDLQQFVFNSVSEEVRNNHIDTLLKEYHAQLTATLELLGAPEEQTISLTQLTQEFESKMLYGLLFTLTILPMINLVPGSELTQEEMVKTNSNLGEDGIFSDLYVRVLKTWLPIFEKKNIL